MLALKSVLIVNSTHATTSSGNLFRALAVAITRHRGLPVEISHLNAGEGGRLHKLRVLLPSWGRLQAAWRADVVITHTSTVFAWQEILLAWCLRKRLVAIYWDAYPESFTPFAKKPKLALAPYGWLERALLRLCDKILPPSPDYIPLLERLNLNKRARVFAMWPFTPILPVTEKTPHEADRPLEIGFAGTMNIIRGLGTALERLADVANGPVIFHSYGHQGPDVSPVLAARLQDAGITLQHHGYVDQSEIMERLAQHDLGLVGLAPEFDLPAFPSKTISYICAGLPILYTGPPLPGYEDFLNRTGIGFVLDDHVTDLQGAFRAHLRDLALAQSRAIAEVELNEARIADLLQ